jgi:hypothetical protein
MAKVRGDGVVGGVMPAPPLPLGGAAAAERALVARLRLVAAVARAGVLREVARTVVRAFAAGRRRLEGIASLAAAGRGAASGDGDEGAVGWGSAAGEGGEGAPASGGRAFCSAAAGWAPVLAGREEERGVRLAMAGGGRERWGREGGQLGMEVRSWGS